MNKRKGYQIELADGSTVEVIPWRSPETPESRAMKKQQASGRSARLKQLHEEMAALGVARRIL